MNTKDNTVETSSKGAVFSGSASHALDPKRRVTIPSGWRDAMGQPSYVFVMADPHAKCLRLMPASLMQQLLDKLKSRRLSDPVVASTLRVIGENSEQLPLDVQGRIRISDRLLAFAGIKGRAAFIGAVAYGEIWAAEERQPTDSVDQVALSEALSALDF
jgi:MraZ protein